MSLTPEQRKSLKHWIPDQHGSWAMVIFPPLVGIYLSGWSMRHLALLVAWMGGFFFLSILNVWLKTPTKRRAELASPLSVYAGIAGIATIFTLVQMPRLAWWGLVFAPLLLIWAREMQAKHERSMTSRTTLIAAGALMTPLSFQVGTYGEDSAALSVHGAAAVQRWIQGVEAGASVSGAGAGSGGVSRFLAAVLGTLGSSWMLVVVLSLLLFAYFWTTVPYVKTLIRNRGKHGTLAFSWVAHLVVFAATAFLAAAGWVTWYLAAIWVLLCVRAVAMPLYSLRKQRRIPTKVIGLSEMVISLFYLVALLV